MIVRILRTRVRKERAHQVRERALAKLEAARRVDGLLDARLMAQAGPVDHAFVFISRWVSMDPLYGWAGGKDLLARPIYFAGLEDFLLEFDIQHYLEIEPA
ncbi:MAG TPA: antibiotic biosynthesis monooxygenase [Candidatus Limnocylindrales bacterium]